ncbi:hypothetical protein [Ruegeria hyattellae]|uniref:hypothetical protein n=1 Tax=Ruegeria hyattellae TaxID=3233337 RepID=UPI00355BFB3A
MIYFLARTIATVSAAATCGSMAYALTNEEIKSLDSNNNGWIEPGPELQELATRRGDLNRRQLVLLIDEQVAPTGKGIPVDQLTRLTIEESLFKDNNPDRRFFLRESIEDVSLLNRNRVAASDAGASFAFGRDNLTNTSSWSAQGAIAWLAYTRPGCGGTGKGALSGCAFAPYLEFQGEGTSTEKGESSLTFGVKSQFEYTGNKKVELHHVSINPFFTTDFDWEAEIYGLSATWRPISTKMRVNAYPARQGDAATYWWNFYGQVRYQNVQEAGRTSFVTGDEYGWVGGHLSYTRVMGNAKVGQFFTTLAYDYYYDVANDRTAELANAQLGVFIDEQTKNSVVLSYSKGRSLQSLTKVDGLGLSLRIAF